MKKRPRQIFWSSRALTIPSSSSPLHSAHPRSILFYRMEANICIYCGLYVVDLTNPELATEEDIHYGIDRWARLFKATTWEELKMITEQDTTLASAAYTVYELSEDERIRQECEAREDWLRRKNGMKMMMKQLKTELKEAKAEKKSIKAELKTLKATKSALQSKYNSLQSENDSLQSENDTLRKELEKLRQQYHIDE